MAATLALALGATLAALAAPTTGVVSAVPAAASSRPNFVVILTDDMRLDDLRYMPLTRRLVQQKGREFTNALATHPLCCPARAELLTGAYAQHNGVRHNNGPHGGFAALKGRGNTIARWLRDTGYRTGFVGKYLNGYEESDGWQAGWSEWKPLVGRLYLYSHFRFFRESGYRDNYVTTRIADRTDSMIRKFHRSGRPFLVMANHIAPHERTIRGINYNPLVQPAYRDLYSSAGNPAQAKPSFNEADVRDKPAWIRRLAPVDKVEMRRLHLARIRSLKSVDVAVGRIVNTLYRTGELANTYVIFTSDNGFSLGEHRFHSKNRLLDENLRIPLVVRGPGIRPGTTDRRLATLLDIPVTIARTAGVAPRRQVDGLSLLRARTRDTVLIQHGGSAASTGGTQWSWRGVMTHRYAWAVNTRNNREETLYDHARDPYELVNVARDPRYAGVRRELRNRFFALVGCAGSNCNRSYGWEPQPRA